MNAAKLRESYAELMQCKYFKSKTSKQHFPYSRWSRFLHVRHPKSDNLLVNEDRDVYTCNVCVPVHKMCMTVSSDPLKRRVPWHSANCRKHFLTSSHWKCVASGASTGDALSQTQSLQRQQQVYMMCLFAPHACLPLVLACPLRLWHIVQVGRV